MGGVADAAWANFTNNVYGSIVALRGTPNGVSSNSRMAIFDAPSRRMRGYLQLEWSRAVLKYMPHSSRDRPACMLVESSQAAAAPRLRLFKELGTPRGAIHRREPSQSLGYPLQRNAASARMDRSPLVVMRLSHAA